MRLLFTIPHCVRAAAGEREHGSLSADPQPRVQALASCLAALHQHFNSPPVFINHERRAAHSFPSADPSRIDVVICTTGGLHILDLLPVPTASYMHFETNAEPVLLGFACHDVLRDHLGEYDFYCYLEDDLVLHDPSFFRKLAWFNRLAGDDAALQPNRFEAALHGAVPKVYVDGDLAARVTSMFQDIEDRGPIVAEAFDRPVRFHRTLNPHSGCFFLNGAQMAHWVRQPHFKDRDSRFIGPLETTASLGLMRTFQVYRPAPANADFLEVQHFGDGYLRQIVIEPEGGTR